MLLSRWIKNNRLNIELDTTSHLNFGLRNYKNYPISFVQYIFNSNNSQANLKTWLSVGSYENTQYIGFFNLDSIRNWLNMDFTTDYIAGFVTNNFFIFDLDQVYSLSGLNFEKKELNPAINDSVIRENNVLKYFKPPGYDVYTEEGRLSETYSNPGEVDIVASNMAVYGIISDGPENLMLSTKDKNNTLEKNYSNRNVKLINHVLDKMRERGFIGVYDNLVNSTQLNEHFTRKLQELYFQQLEQLLNNSNHPNHKGIKDTIKSIKELIIINGEGKDENIQLNHNNKYNVNTGKYSRVFDQLKKFGINVISFYIKGKENEYINEKFIGALLNIASFLNNPTYRENTITIFNEVNEIANEHYTNINAAKNKYIEEKNKYMELKSLYGFV